MSTEAFWQQFKTELARYFQQEELKHSIFPLHHRTLISNKMKWIPDKQNNLDEFLKISPSEKG